MRIFSSICQFLIRNSEYLVDTLIAGVYVIYHCRWYAHQGTPSTMEGKEWPRFRIRSHSRNWILGILLVAIWWTVIWQYMTFQEVSHFLRMCKGTCERSLLPNGCMCAVWAAWVVLLSRAESSYYKDGRGELYIPELSSVLVIGMCTAVLMY